MFCRDRLVFQPKQKKNLKYCKKEDWGIGYDDIAGLARGQPNSPLGNLITFSSASAAVGTAVGAKGSAVAVGTTIGVTAAALIAWYYWHHMKQNFIAIFFGPNAPCTKRERCDVRKATQKGNVNFPKGDMAIFQIYNGHNYWNISMILDAKTGLEWQSEYAVVGAPAK